MARLTKRTKPEDFVYRFSEDYRSVELSPRERSILDYAVTLTERPAQVREEDLQPMRDAGLSDVEILDVCLITSYFAYVNRIADGLGVGVESEDDSKVGW